MSKMAFDKIAEGLNEALAVARDSPEAFADNDQRYHLDEKTVPIIKALKEAGELRSDYPEYCYKPQAEIDAAASREEVAAFGIRNPDGELCAFASFNATALWALLAELGMAKDEDTAKAALEAKGWRVVPVTITPALCAAKSHD